LTLESPGVRQQVIDALRNNRKQLLTASYQSIAMNEAKIENYLAKKVVENPNELSGARPAVPETPAPANSNATAAPANNGSASNTNSGSSANSSASSAVNKPAVNANAKPAANANGK